MSVSAPQIARVRKFFSRLDPVIDIPYLIQTTKESYANFLQLNVPPDARKPYGLQGVFQEIFPITDFNETARLEFLRYEIEPPKFDEDECRQKSLTYEAPLRLTVRLIVWETSDDSGERHVRDIKEQDVYFGNIPLMTENGTFIINGTERVIVSQLHRSPGVYFDHDKGKSHSSGKILFSGHIIPYRGSWLDFEFDHKDLLYARIDRRRKLYATLLLRALGMSEEQILARFYPFEKVRREGDGLVRTFFLEYLHGQKLNTDVVDPQSGEVIIRKGRKIRRAQIRKLEEAGITELPMQWEELVGRVAAREHVDPTSGELLLEANEELTPEHVEKIRGIEGLELELLYIDGTNVGPYVRNTLLADKVTSADEARVEIYRRMRPGDPVTIDGANEFFHSLFFDPQRYDLGEVGRLKLNFRLRREKDLDDRTLDAEDIIRTLECLIDVKHGRIPIDDIDHLGNRRVRSVGELLENQFRIGVVRMERAIRERMSLAEVETMVPHELINSKPALAAVKDFFSSGQLSQFMDQTNPLSEVTHKRRLSALGPGGLSRERAGFEVRDVHPSHYGRICPIETPEGPNIGLISSLASYARVNRFGFIETPYRVVKNGVVTDEVVYLSALEEEGKRIAQANAPVDEKNRFVNELVSARLDGNFVMLPRGDIDLMDVSPKQLVSVAASLIPFLEHDDANRALMGSNMQRQAVPLLKPQAPFVGTGMEAVVGRDSGRGVNAKRSGVVERVESSRIVVRVDESETKPDEGDAGVDIYKLIKFHRSNQDTCVNQVPIVKVGDRVEAGDVIADGSAMDRGELALGQNVLVAFMPWRGYNFEDSILLSERLVRDDTFTSIHIKEFECVSRDTKLGPEEITRDIPNLSEEALRNLDESGIVRIGAQVRPNDILVGKITPKGETLLSPEEKLLRSIFGSKAMDVRDTSLRVPAGISGTVIGAQIFLRKGAEKDFRTLEIERQEIESLERDKADEIAIVEASVRRKLREMAGRSRLTKGVKIGKEMYGKADAALPSEAFDAIPLKKFLDLEWKDADLTARIHEFVHGAVKRIAGIEKLYNDKIERLQREDELPPGVIKLVKVFVAIKRKIGVGDKMAGRHGNKGVVSRILPIEDMPFLDDGTPVDVVLNPLGVPSRMNVGQVLETHLGLAVRGLGMQLDQWLSKHPEVEATRKKLKELYPSKRVRALIDEADPDQLMDLANNLRTGIFIASPVFDGASEDEIRELLRQSGLPESGQVRLRDGLTGEPFLNPVTVGIMYMLKLNHMVDDKIHARSIGPYSLVTQQPLGGKAQFGGQRLGEMEVWALEAYGAAYALQEFLTVKSDDVQGRTRVYESIVKGEFALEAGLPESFNVLIKELQGLGLNVELLETDEAMEG